MSNPSLLIKVIVGIVSGAIGTINLLLDKGVKINLTLNDVYRAILMTAWFTIIMSIYEILIGNNQMFDLLAGIGILVISFIAIRIQMFVDKGSRTSEIKRNQELALRATIKKHARVRLDYKAITIKLNGIPVQLVMRLVQTLEHRFDRFLSSKRRCLLPRTLVVFLHGFARVLELTNPICIGRKVATTVIKHTIC